MASELPRREPEIDGLRSLAIVPVVLYHAGWKALPGGFVGVDVFFVISGYLITRILDAEMAAGRYSLLGFYERRVRRIVPALLMVLLATAAVSYAIALPDDLSGFGNSLIYTVLFLSNIFFAVTQDYFVPAADNYALLHTWSLAVEEQFYLLFPFILLGAFHLLGKHRIWPVALLATASFGLSVATSRGDPTGAFYLPMARGWELLAGSLLALGVLRFSVPRWLGELLSVTGLAAIVWTLFGMPRHAVFPGWIAAVPVLGAVALIRFAPGTLVGRILSLPPLVGIGLISYSLYLWHWPLLMLTSYWLLRPLRPIEAAVLIGVAFGLAFLSYRLVEQPFRNRQFFGRSQIFGLAGAGMTALLLIGLWPVATGGVPQRVPAEVVRLASFAHDINPQRAACHQRPVDRSCALGARVAPSIAVWGDSHGIEMAYALGEAAGKQGKALIEITRSACAPGLGTGVRIDKICAAHNDEVLAFLGRTTAIDTVIVTLSIGDHGDEENVRFLPHLQKAIAALRGMGKTVALVFPDAADRTPVPRRLALQLWRRGAFKAVNYPLDQLKRRLAGTYAAMNAIVETTGAIPIDPTDATCPNGICVDYLNGVVLLFDRHHPSLSAARLMAPLYANVIAAAGRP